MALWARLLNSENAYRMILKLITLVPPGEKVGFEGGLYTNLWTAHIRTVAVVLLQAVILPKERKEQ